MVGLMLIGSVICGLLYYVTGQLNEIIDLLKVKK